MTHNNFGVVYAISGDKNLESVGAQGKNLNLAKIPCRIENIHFCKIFNFSAIIGSIKKIK